MKRPKSINLASEARPQVASPLSDKALRHFLRGLKSPTTARYLHVFRQLRLQNVDLDYALVTVEHYRELKTPYFTPLLHLLVAQQLSVHRLDYLAGLR